MRRRFRLLLAFPALACLLSACASTGVPDGIEPVRPFTLKRYLGTWYEIARLDHRFERGLEAVSAEYARTGDGDVEVVNRGWSTEEGAWREASGTARFAGADDVGHLAVSFFGPFYASYVVFELDDGYQRAFVTGNDRDTLWFLSRTPTVSDADYTRFVSRAAALGFATDELIRVDQARNAAR